MTPQVSFSLSQIEKLVAPAFPGRKVLSSAAAEGGLANTNICVTLEHKHILLKLFQRDPAQALKEVRLNEFVAGTVPTAKVYFFGETNEVTGQPYAVMEWIYAVRLETVVDHLSSSESGQMAERLGATLCAIHDFKFPKFGILDNKLRVDVTLQFGGADILAYASDCLMNRNGSVQLGRRLSERALEFLSKEVHILDDFPAQPCLAHCDFGGSNILVKRKGDDWQIAAVLDWEFAWSGTPYMDLGNLLRKPLGAIPHFPTKVHDSYIACGGNLASEWRRLSLITDLCAWFEFATRTDAGEELVADARAAVSDTIDNWSRY
jgi:aminoglycoside phosphotransferase (APT) family kinase protein